ncbi:unnamed protein product, partial [marine sediment metagenome]
IHAIGEVGLYEWAGQIGILSALGVNAKGQTGQYIWNGFPGDLDIGDGSSPFFEFGQAGLYQWQGQPGVVDIGFNDTGLHSLYEWSGQVGELQAGWEDVGLHTPYEWQGFDGDLSALGVTLEGQAGQYQWQGFDGIEVRGYDALRPDTFSLYTWTGYPGRVFYGD